MIVGDLQVYIKYNNILCIKELGDKGKKYNDKDIKVRKEN